MSTNDEQKTCWACGKKLVGDDGKLGLCTTCMNSYGSPALAFAGLGIAFLFKKGVDHLPDAIRLVKNIRR